MSHNNIVGTQPISLAQKYSDFAAGLLDDGTSFLPISLNGSKKPDWSVLPLDEHGDPAWLPLQTRLPTNDEVSKWFGNGVTRGLGIIHGRLSPDHQPRELLDIDVEKNEKRATLASQFLADERICNITNRCPVVTMPTNLPHHRPSFSTCHLCHLPSDRYSLCSMNASHVALESGCSAQWHTRCLRSGALAATYSNRR